MARQQRPHVRRTTPGSCESGKAWGIAWERASNPWKCGIPMEVRHTRGSAAYPWKRVKARDGQRRPIIARRTLRNQAQAPRTRRLQRRKGKPPTAKSFANRAAPARDTPLFGGGSSRDRHPQALPFRRNCEADGRKSRRCIEGSAFAQAGPQIARHSHRRRTVADGASRRRGCGSACAEHSTGPPSSKQEV